MQQWEPRCLTAYAGWPTRLLPRPALPAAATAKLMAKARERLEGGGRGYNDSWPAGHRVAHFYATSAEDFVPQPGRYDLVWLQVGGWAGGWLGGGPGPALAHRLSSRGVLLLGPCANMLR